MAKHETKLQVFAERIKSLRLEKKLTQKQMAETLEINERTYQNFEAGRYLPSNTTMMAIISNFGMETLNYLIGATNYRPDADGNIKVKVPADIFNLDTDALKKKLGQD